MRKKHLLACSPASGPRDEENIYCSTNYTHHLQSSVKKSDKMCTTHYSTATVTWKKCKLLHYLFVTLDNLNVQLILCLYIIFICFLPKCEMLRIIRVSVPRKSLVGDTVWLNCSHDLTDTQLYSIKWYKDSEEIYRFLPSNKPTHAAYETDGLTIDVSLSSSSSFALSLFPHNFSSSCHS